MPGDADGPMKWYEWNGATWDATRVGQQRDSRTQPRGRRRQRRRAPGHFCRRNGQPWRRRQCGLLGVLWQQHGQLRSANGLGRHRQPRFKDRRPGMEMGIWTSSPNRTASGPRGSMCSSTMRPFWRSICGSVTRSMPTCRRGRCWVSSGDLDGDIFPEVFSGGWRYQNPLTARQSLDADDHRKRHSMNSP